MKKIKLLKSVNGKSQIKHVVFWPPFLLLLAAVVLNFIDQETFISVTENARGWVLDTFGWLFSLGAFFMLMLCIAIYFSPFSRVIIGGPQAKPILTKWRWFTIALCTGMAIGVVLWCAAEPMYYLSDPPKTLQIAPNSPEAALFAKSSMYLHWSVIPYSLYSVVGLTFAFAYYNMRKPFSLGSPLWPLLGRRCEGVIGHGIDALCLYALVAGMAGSLGGGLLLLSGGLNHMFGIESGKEIWALIALAIVGTFTISAVTGLMKGIRVLSSFNTLLFVCMLIFVFIFGPTRFILSFGVESLGNFLGNFFQKSLFTGAAASDTWAHKWTIFHWANCVEQKETPFFDVVRRYTNEKVLTQNGNC